MSKPTVLPIKKATVWVTDKYGFSRFSQYKQHSYAIIGVRERDENGRYKIITWEKSKILAQNKARQLQSILDVDKELKMPRPKTLQVGNKDYLDLNQKVDISSEVFEGEGESPDTAPGEWIRWTEDYYYRKVSKVNGTIRYEVSKYDGFVYRKLNPYFSNKEKAVQFMNKEQAVLDESKIEKTSNTTFDTGAVRGTDLDQDYRYDLISPLALRAIAATYAEGAKKYSAGNYLKGIPISNLVNHAMNHIELFRTGDKSENHLAHAVWNLMTIIHFKAVERDEELKGDMVYLDLEGNGM